jgi:hypothetical protein
LPDQRWLAGWWGAPWKLTFEYVPVLDLPWQHTSFVDYAIVGNVDNR